MTPAPQKEPSAQREQPQRGRLGDGGLHPVFIGADADANEDIRIDHPAGARVVEPRFVDALNPLAQGDKPPFAAGVFGEPSAAGVLDGDARLVGRAGIVKISLEVRRPRKRPQGRVPVPSITLVPQVGVLPLGTAPHA